jgi:hypothetical protein
MQPKGGQSIYRNVFNCLISKSTALSIPNWILDHLKDGNKIKDPNEVDTELNAPTPELQGR